MTFKEIRQQQYLYHKTCEYSKDWNWKSPYTYMKAHLYMEGAAVLVYLLQKVWIDPNIITVVYGLLGMIGGALLVISSKMTISIAAAIFFFRGILDLADGHYARLTHQTSYLGKQLDYYSGKIGTIAFYAGLVLHIIQVNVYALIYLPVLWFMHKLDGRARTVDFICLFLLIEILFY